MAKPVESAVLLAPQVSHLRYAAVMKLLLKTRTCAPSAESIFIHSYQLPQVMNLLMFQPVHAPLTGLLQRASNGPPTIDSSDKGRRLELRSPTEAINSKGQHLSGGNTLIVLYNPFS